MDTLTPVCSAAAIILESHSEKNAPIQSTSCSLTSKNSTTNDPISSESIYPPFPIAPSSKWQRFQDTMFLITTLLSQFNCQCGWGASLICIQDIGKWLGTDESGQYSWMLATYGLTMGLFVILTGRLGDKYGHKKIIILGYILFTLSNLGTGFCKTSFQFDILRAISGIAAAMVQPNSGALLARRWMPGKARTVGFALMGAGGPMGCFVGALIGAAVNHAFGPRWIFFTFALITFITGVAAIFTLPQDDVSGEGSLDLLGCSVGFTGLILFDVAWNSATVVGWQVTYVWLLLLISVLFLLGFYFYERWKGDEAILPIRLFKPEVVWVCLAMWWTWMSNGCFVFYTTSFLRDFRGVKNPLMILAQIIPMAPAGIVAALSVIFLFQKVSAHYIFALAMLAFALGSLLSALSDVDQSYWKLTFPAVVIQVFGPDLSYASAALIIANNTERNLQGVASSLVVLITNYSSSIGLGMAGTVEFYVRLHGGTLLEGYKAALWFGFALSMAGLVLVCSFVRTGQSKAQGLTEDVASRV